MSKQNWKMKIYKKDKRITRADSYSRNKVGYRCVGTYEFQQRDEASMQREIRELRGLYPVDMFLIEIEPATMIVKNLMTGQDVEIPSDTPRCCNPASETYWSM